MAPEVTWRLHAGLGATLRTQGAIDNAAQELRAAIADIERTGRSLTLPERRSGFFTDKWDVYVQLAMLERARGRVGAAFEVSERIRAGEMLELLRQGRVAAPQDTAAELVSSEQDLRRHIAGLTSQLEGAGAGTQPLRGPDLAPGGAVTREALLRAQASYAELLLEIRERAPRHAALLSRETATSRDVARRLQADEAFIEYLVSDASSLAFVVTRDTAVALQLPVNRHDLARLIDFVRGTLQPQGSPRLDSLWRDPLRQLYQDLIAPIEASGLLAGKTRLTIVPHAELHYLPFAALLGGTGREQFLIERFQVMVTPSASVWLALGARPRDTHTTRGILAFAPQPERLPASRGEVAAIAARWRTPCRGRKCGDRSRVSAGGPESSGHPPRDQRYCSTKQNPLFSFVAFCTRWRQRWPSRKYMRSSVSTSRPTWSCSRPARPDSVPARSPGCAGRRRLDRPVSRISRPARRGSWRRYGGAEDQTSAALMEQFYKEYAVGADPGRALAAAQRAAGDTRHREPLLLGRIRKLVGGR